MWRSRLLATLVISLLALFTLLATMRDYGMVIDEATYVWVAREARLWFGELPERGLADSLSQEGLARRFHFLEPPFSRGAGEHSNFNLPVSAHVMNAGWLLAHWFTDELTAYRFGSALLFALTIGAVYATVAAEKGWITGLLAAAAILLTPRIFGHAHLAATETPLCCFWLCSLLALFQMSASPKPKGQRAWAIAFGLLVGLTMGVKLTGWLMVPPTLLWLIAFRPPGWRWAIAAAALIAPVLIVLMTPPLWYHPIGGLLDYVRAASSNPWKITTYYLGQGYEGKLPASSGLVLVAVTTPVTLLVLSLVGALTAIRDRFALLIVLNAGIVLGFRTLGWMPEHDGERQFLPYFYFAAILAALGADRIGRWLVGKLKPRDYRDVTLHDTYLRIGNLNVWNSGQGGVRLQSVVCGVGLLAALALLAEPAVESWRYRGHALSYYNALVGGLPGAAAKGFEISYWFEAATDDVWKRFLADLPPNSRLFLRPDHPGLEFLKEKGIWRSDLQSVGPDEADYWLLYAKRAAYVIKDANGQPVVTDLIQVQELAPAAREERFLGIRMIGLFPTGRTPPVRSAN